MHFAILFSGCKEIHKSVSKQQRLFKRMYSCFGISGKEIGIVACSRFYAYITPFSKWVGWKQVMSENPIIHLGKSIKCLKFTNHLHDTAPSHHPPLASSRWFSLLTYSFQGHTLKSSHGVHSLPVSRILVGFSSNGSSQLPLLIPNFKGGYL